MLDLVYMHCGPKAKMIDEHPDFVKRNEDGSLALNSYCFATINFDNPELCKYLQDNMVYFAEKFDVDGYRLDVGDRCPLDFWCEGARRVREIKPEFIFLNEGRLPEFVRDFCDANYGLDWTYYAMRDVFNGKFNATKVKEQWQKDFDLLPKGALQCRAYENHDVSTDAFENRMERVNGAACGELALVINFLIDGVPFIYNGNEIADSGRHSFFANRFPGGYLGIDWSAVNSPEAQRRMAKLRELVALKRESRALYEGEVVWNETDSPEKIVCFSRVAGDEKVTLYANVTKEAVEFSHNGREISLPPYGYEITKN
jgi:glycosidase